MRVWSDLLGVVVVLQRLERTHHYSLQDYKSLVTSYTTDSLAARRLP